MRGRSFPRGQPVDERVHVIGGGAWTGNRVEDLGDGRRGQACGVRFADRNEEGALIVGEEGEPPEGSLVAMSGGSMILGALAAVSSRLLRCSA